MLAIWHACVCYRDDMWCNGQHFSFPSKQVLEYKFKYQLGHTFSGFSIRNSLKLVVRVFLRVLQYPPLLHQLIVSVNEIKLKWMQIQLCHNVIAELSLRTTWHTLHVISAWYVAHDLHVIAPWPMERVCWRQFCGTVSRRKKMLDCTFQYHYIIVFIIINGEQVSIADPWI